MVVRSGIAYLDFTKGRKTFPVAQANEEHWPPVRVRAFLIREYNGVVFRDNGKKTMGRGPPSALRADHLCWGMTSLIYEPCLLRLGSFDGCDLAILRVLPVWGTRRS